MESPVKDTKKASKRAWELKSPTQANVAEMI